MDNGTRTPQGEQADGALFADHEIEVVLTLNTTRDDVREALRRSGIVEGALIGEALVEMVSVYSPIEEDDE